MPINRWGLQNWPAIPEAREAHFDPVPIPLNLQRLQGLWRWRAQVLSRDRSRQGFSLRLQCNRSRVGA
jgi:hypothetical protein